MTADPTNEPHTCTHGVLMTLDCLDCDAEVHDPDDLAGHPRQDFADSVGMRLHD